MSMLLSSSVKKFVEDWDTAKGVPSIKTIEKSLGFRISQYDKNYVEEYFTPKYISIDAESDGLWGPVFCIAVTIHSYYGRELEHHVFTYNNYTEDIKNEWVRENVLPAIELPGDTDYARSRLGMLSHFADFWLKHKDLSVMWHMGHIVETGLFRELRELELIGDFDAPYNPIEISSYLRWSGCKDDSVDTYAQLSRLDIKGSTHDPLYDCRVAAAVWFHLTEYRSVRCIWDERPIR